MKSLAIIPAYNEQDSILSTIEDLKRHIPEMDILVVNDCSNDRTEELLDEHKIPHISLPINLGLSGAVQAGYIYAAENHYDCAMQFDGDGQHPAEYIPQMIQEINNGYDIVIGSRFVENKKDLSMRMIGSRIISALIFLKTRTRVKDPTSGMRLLNAKMLHEYAFNMNRQPEPDTLVLVIRKGAKIKEIQVEMRDRVAGKSIYGNVWSSIQYMIHMIVSIIFLS